MICKHQTHTYGQTKKARNNFVIWILLFRGKISMKKIKKVVDILF